MGFVFTLMGIATMIFPSLVLKYSITTQFQHHCFSNNGEDINPIVKLLTQCFGSQATLCGVLILSTNFDTFSFKIFGMCMIPYFIFDLLAYQQGYLTEFGAIGDGVGNLIFSICSFIGYAIESKDLKKDE